MEEMSELEIQSANRIKDYWQKRRLKKKIMYDIFVNFRERYRRAWNTYLLIDEFLDENICTLLKCFDERATRLKIMSYRKYEVLHTIPDD